MADLKKTRGGASKRVFAPNVNKVVKSEPGTDGQDATSSNVAQEYSVPSDSFHNKGERGAPRGRGKPERGRGKPVYKSQEGIFSRGIAASSSSQPKFVQSTATRINPVDNYELMEHASKVKDLGAMLGGDSDDEGVGTKGSKKRSKRRGEGADEEPMSDGEEGNPGSVPFHGFASTEPQERPRWLPAAPSIQIGQDQPPKIEEEKLYLLQLPYVLPTATRLLKTDVKTEEPDGVEQNRISDQGPEKFENQLLRLREGQIGKFRVRRSGKMELVLGEVVMDLEASIPSHFLQNVACINTESTRPYYVNLGSLAGQFVATPNIEKLLSAPKVVPDKSSTKATIAIGKSMASS